MALMNISDSVGPAKVLGELRRGVTVADLRRVAQTFEPSLLEFGEQGAKCYPDRRIPRCALVELVLLLDQESLGLADMAERTTVAPLLAAVRIRLAPLTNDPGFPSLGLVQQVRGSDHDTPLNRLSRDAGCRRPDPCVPGRQRCRFGPCRPLRGSSGHQPGRRSLLLAGNASPFVARSVKK